MAQNPLTPPDLLQTLRQIWGFPELRPVQKDVVQATLQDRDAVVVMPTGGGKSLCFQLPAIHQKRLTVVVSPLIALMKDQVDALHVVGVQAAALNSALNPENLAQTLQDLRQGKIQLLYISPERLLAPQTIDLLKTADQGQGPARFAIDEAHCISAWGHDFRPEYRKLHCLKANFPQTPVQAFTATATPKVQRDIAIQLRLVKPKLFVGTFDRPNLTYRVVAKDDPVRRIAEAVRRYPDEGVVVYCLARADTERIAKALQEKGIPAVAYHAGLPQETRRQVSEDFAAERANIVVATVAFGMGIDRSNVRCVVHECLPKSIEGYQQETGRAGRDGLPAECVLLYTHADVARLQRLLAGGESQPRETLDHHLRLLQEVRRYATSHTCRHQTLSQHFGQPYNLPPEGCGACDVCLGGTQPLKDSPAIALKILTAASLLEIRRNVSVTLLANTLAGSKSKAVVQARADRITEYAALSGTPTSRLTFWIHQLVDQGLLATTEGPYPVLSLTHAAREALKSQTPITLVENTALHPVDTTKTGKQSKSRHAGAEALAPADQTLFQSLRAWRRAAAAERQIPPYVIFHDTALIQIATARPTTQAQLARLPGIGQKRAADYAPAVLPLVQAAPP